MAKWWERASDEEKEENKNKENKNNNSSAAGEEIELKPSEVKAKLDKIDSMESQLNNFTQKAEVLDSMKAFLDKQKAEEDRKAAVDRAKAVEDNKTSLEEEFLTDPQNAVKKTIRPLVESHINLQSRNMTRDLVDSNPEKYEYYTDPTFRAHMDSLIASLPLEQRISTAAIENCYYVAEGHKKQEIKDGKIKSRLSAASNSASGTGASSGKSEETITLNDDEKKAARAFGMSEVEYANAKRKEMSYV